VNDPHLPVGSQFQSIRPDWQVEMLPVENFADVEFEPSRDDRDGDRVLTYEREKLPCSLPQRNPFSNEPRHLVESVARQDSCLALPCLAQTNLPFVQEHVDLVRDFVTVRREFLYKDDGYVRVDQGSVEV
jgi:hypothetical protein